MMKSPQDILVIAEQRLEEAQVLYDNNMFDGAFHLAGYSIELTLKAKICKIFDVADLFSDQQSSEGEDVQVMGNDNNKRKIIAVKDKVKKMLQTHDLDVLMWFCGLHLKYENYRKQTQDAQRNTALVSTWNTNTRYKTNTISAEQVKNLISFLQDKEGLLQWIKNN